MATLEHVKLFNIGQYVLGANKLIKKNFSVFTSFSLVRLGFTSLALRKVRASKNYRPYTTRFLNHTRCVLGRVLRTRPLKRR